VLIEYELRLVEIYKKRPGFPTISGGMDLAVHCAYVKPVLIPRIDSDYANIAAIRAYYRPFTELCGVAEYVPIPKRSKRKDDRSKSGDQETCSETKSLCGLGHNA
jgi:hypothetical protein